MLDIGWQELFIVAVIAIVVIGPKELPRAVKTVAQLLRKARGMAREFQDGIDDLVREAELDDLKKEITDGSPTSIAQHIENTIDPSGDLKDAVREIDPTSEVRDALDTTEESPSPADPETAGEDQVQGPVEPAPETAGEDEVQGPVEPAPAADDEAEPVIERQTGG
jgi:sec-independent protein translocase protein TatB